MIRTRFITDPNISSTINDDGGVLLDVDRGVVFSLNAVGAKVWAQLEEKKEGMTGEDLLDYMAREFNLSRQQLQSDLHAFLKELNKRWLVQVSN